MIDQIAQSELSSAQVIYYSEQLFSWPGLGIVFVAIVSYFLYGQKLDAVAVFGIAMIIAGILVINLFSKTAGH